MLRWGDPSENLLRVGLIRSSFVALAGIAALAAPSSAKERPIPEAILIFTDNYATALGLEAACSTWRVDRAKAAIALVVSGLPEDA
jgi:hypothetical protein